MKLPLRSGASRGVVRDADNRLLVVMEEDRGAAEELVRLVNSAAELEFSNHTLKESLRIEREQILDLCTQVTELERVNRELAAEIARMREASPDLKSLGPDLPAALRPLVQLRQAFTHGFREPEFSTIAALSMRTDLFDAMHAALDKLAEALK